MRRLTRTKTFTMILVIVLTILIGFVFALTFATKYYVSAQRDNMLDLYESICEIYGDSQNIDLYSESKRKQMDMACEQTQVSLYIMDPSGNTVFSYGDSYILDDRLAQLLFGKEDDASAVYDGGSFVIQNIVGDEDVKYVEMWGILDNNCIFIARTSYSSIENSIRITMRFFGFVSLGVVITIIVMLILLNHSYTRSLKRLIKAAQETNEGNFEFKFESSKGHKDDLGILGDNIAQLAEKLEKTISELKSSNLNLENELKARIALEESRKKYMSDVSHELKTPLALISGYAEGLKEGIGETQEDRDYYLDVIIDEAEKMNIIIKRLATLNQLEQGQSAVSLERFDVVEAIDGFLNTMSIVLEEKGVDVYFDNSSRIFVWADEFLFEEVFINYINNAINHVDENRVIEITLRYTQSRDIRISVFNSGENIPEDETDKIWDKFYKVDKARTRAYGGSGLGLSIVKAVADSLGKECGVENRPDGVAFWIDLEAASDPDIVMDAEEIESSKLINIPLWRKRRNEEVQDAEFEVIPDAHRPAEFEVYSDIARKAGYTVESEKPQQEAAENDEDKQGLGSGPQGGDTEGLL